MKIQTDIPPQRPGTGKSKRIFIRRHRGFPFPLRGGVSGGVYPIMQLFITLQRQIDKTELK